MATKLSVNVNAVAMLRNRRDLPWPDVVDLSRIALQAGAHGITVHPRPDERHIRRQDVFDLTGMIRREFPSAEFNIEGYPTSDFLDLVAATRPDQATLVPDEPGQATSDHGWDIPRHRDLLREVIRRLKSDGARVSIFTDADPGIGEHARAVGADRIEIYTGPYGHTFEPGAKMAHLDAIVATATQAKVKGLGVNAGHDLTRDNLPPLVARVPFLAEVSIGHALIGDALIFGMAETVRRYIAAAAG